MRVEAFGESYTQESSIAKSEASTPEQDDCVDETVSDLGLRNSTVCSGFLTLIASSPGTNEH